MEKIEINTGRLTMKPLNRDYLETANQYALDRENVKYMEFLPNENSDETLSFLKSVEAEWEKDEPGTYEFAIIHEGKHIGAVSVYYEGDVAELGWILNKNSWGHGFAAEAAQGLIDYFSKTKGTKRFIAGCDTRNVASYKTMEKLGMTRFLEYEGRKNRASDEPATGYKYELIL